MSASVIKWLNICRIKQIRNVPCGWANHSREGREDFKKYWVIEVINFVSTFFKKFFSFLDLSTSDVIGKIFQTKPPDTLLSTCCLTTGCAIQGAITFSTTTVVAVFLFWSCDGFHALANIFQILHSVSRSFWNRSRLIRGAKKLAV